MIIRMILIAIIILLYGCATNLPQHQCVHGKPRNCIRFATYNVYWENSTSDKHNPNSIIYIINEINPDIIVLQETHSFSEKHLEKCFKASHPYQLFCDQKTSKSENGLGILSKYPIVQNIYFPPKYGWFPGWLYVIKTPNGYLQVLNVHLNPPLVSDDNIGLLCEGLWLTPKFRLQEISYYCKHLNPHIPTIIAGDFNESDNGIACNFLRNCRYIDIISKKISNWIITWHYKFACFTLTGRYDRIYTTRDIRTISCQILPKGYSDHYPIVVDVLCNQIFPSPARREKVSRSDG